MVAEKIKLSEKTLSILKNYSGICSNILIKPGNVLRTVSSMKNIMSEAVIEEDFERQVAIWDLNQFLGTVSLFDSPEFEFEENHVNIYGKNGSSVRYYYSAPNLITTPTKDIVMPETVVEFDLKQRDLVELQRAASVLGLPDICVQSNGDTLEMVAVDKKINSSNTYSVSLGDLPNDGHDFKFYFKVENLKMFPGDYTVSIAKSVVSQFVHKTTDIKYWIALEADSVYNG
jgi:hypothetical protein